MQVATKRYKVNLVFIIYNLYGKVGEGGGRSYINLYPGNIFHMLALFCTSRNQHNFITILPHLFASFLSNKSNVLVVTCNNKAYSHCVNSSLTNLSMGFFTSQYIIIPKISKK